MKVYKLVRRTNKGLFPLYVNAEEEFISGEWMQATEGERLENGKVKAKYLSQLAFRPGFHSTEVPFADHIYSIHNGVKYQKDNTVWVECETKEEIDYNTQAKERGMNKQGKLVHRNACLDFIPRNGYYQFQTNAQAKVSWFISGELKPLRVLEHSEVEEICRTKGLEPLPVYQ